MTTLRLPVTARNVIGDFYNLIWMGQLNARKTAFHLSEELNNDELATIGRGFADAMEMFANIIHDLFGRPDIDGMALLASLGTRFIAMRREIEFNLANTDVFSGTFRRMQAQLFALAMLQVYLENMLINNGIVASNNYEGSQDFDIDAMVEKALAAQGKIFSEAD